MRIKKTPLIICLMLSMFLAAVEGTIVTIATPTIVRDLSGFEFISMVFSTYFLTSAISTPIYGKLADMFGRKKILSIGIFIFLTGSLLCGLSQTMAQLIGFRALQGLGAGSILTISFTIIGDVFPVEERTKIQGGLSMMWGLASLVGPFLGGVIIDLLSWHWIFYINLPFGLLAVVLLHISLTESEDLTRRKHSIDYAGIATLSLAMITFLSIFLLEDLLGDYQTLYIVSAVLMTSLFLWLFYKVEQKAKEPIVPFEVLTKTNIFINLISFLLYSILIGFSVYMPIYMQNVRGYSPTVAGLTILPTDVAWLMIAFLLGRFLLKYGGKAVIQMASCILLLSTFLLSTLGISTPLVLVLLYGFTIGIAFGAIATATTILIQESVDSSKRGAAVATNTLLRALGQTIGISIFGNIFNASIVKYFVAKGIHGINPSNLYQSASTATILSTEQIQLALQNGIHILFLVFIFLACLSLVLATIMPKPKEIGFSIKSSS